MPTTNAWNSNVPVEVTKGGTNATSFATATGIVKYDGTRLVTSTDATIDANNLYTNTSQPRFLAVRNGNVSNVTGNGTTYNPVFNNELYDIGSNYDNGTGIFTAPKAGVYLFTYSIYLTGVGTSMTFAVLSVNTTSGTTLSQFGRKSGETTDIILQTACLRKMAAGNTAQCAITISGGPGDTADLYGPNYAVTGFQGILLT
jgi:hypothetical protein